MAPLRPLARKCFAIALSLSLLPLPPAGAWAAADVLEPVKTSITALEPTTKLPLDKLSAQDKKDFLARYIAFQGQWSQAEAAAKEPQIAGELQKLAPARDKIAAFAATLSAEPNKDDPAARIAQASGQLSQSEVAAALAAGDISGLLDKAYQKGRLNGAQLTETQNALRKVRAEARKSGTDLEKLYQGAARNVSDLNRPAPPPVAAPAQAATKPDPALAAQAAAAYRGLADKATALFNTGAKKEDRAKTIAEIDAELKKLEAQEKGAPADPKAAAERERVRTLLKLLKALDVKGIDLADLTATQRKEMLGSEANLGGTAQSLLRHSQSLERLTAALAASKVLDGDPAQLAKFFDNAQNRQLAAGTPVAPLLKAWLDAHGKGDKAAAQPPAKREALTRQLIENLKVLAGAAGDDPQRTTQANLYLAHANLNDAVYNHLQAAPQKAQQYKDFLEAYAKLKKGAPTAENLAQQQAVTDKARGLIEALPQYKAALLVAQRAAGYSDALVKAKADPKATPELQAGIADRSKRQSVVAYAELLRETQQAGLAKIDPKAWAAATDEAMKTLYGADYKKATAAQEQQLRKAARTGDPEEMRKALAGLRLPGLVQGRDGAPSLAYVTSADVTNMAAAAARYLSGKKPDSDKPLIGVLGLIQKKAQEKGLEFDPSNAASILSAARQAGIPIYDEQFLSGMDAQQRQALKADLERRADGMEMQARERALAGAQLANRNSDERLVKLADKLGLAYVRTAWDDKGKAEQAFDAVTKATANSPEARVNAYALAMKSQSQGAIFGQAAPDRLSVSGWTIGLDHVAKVERRREYVSGDGLVAELGPIKADIPYSAAGERLALPSAQTRDGLVYRMENGNRQFVASDGRYSEEMKAALTGDGRPIFRDSKAQTQQLEPGKTVGADWRPVTTLTINEKFGDGRYDWRTTSLSTYRAQAGDQVASVFLNQGRAEVMMTARPAAVLLSATVSEVHRKEGEARGLVTSVTGDGGGEWTQTTRAVAYEAGPRGEVERVQRVDTLRGDPREKKLTATSTEYRYNGADGETTLVTRQLFDGHLTAGSAATPRRAATPDSLPADLEAKLRSRVSADRQGIALNDKAARILNIGGDLPENADAAARLRILKRWATEAGDPDQASAAATMLGYTFDQQLPADKRARVSVSLTPGKTETEEKMVRRRRGEFADNGNGAATARISVREREVISKRTGGAATVTITELDESGRAVSERTMHWQETVRKGLPKPDEAPADPRGPATAQLADQVKQTRSMQGLIGMNKMLTERNEQTASVFVLTENQNRVGADGREHSVSVAAGFVLNGPDGKPQFYKIETADNRTVDKTTLHHTAQTAAAQQLELAEQMRKEAQKGGFFQRMLSLNAAATMTEGAGNTAAVTLLASGAYQRRVTITGPDGKAYTTDIEVGRTTTLINGGAHLGDYTNNSIRHSDFGDLHPRSAAILGGVAGGIIEGVLDPTTYAFIAASGGLGALAKAGAAFQGATKLGTTAARVGGRVAGVTKEGVDTYFKVMMTVGAVTAGVGLTGAVYKDDIEGMNGNVKELTVMASQLGFFAAGTRVISRFQARDVGAPVKPAETIRPVEQTRPPETARTQGPIAAEPAPVVVAGEKAGPPAPREVAARSRSAARVEPTLDAAAETRPASEPLAPAPRRTVVQRLTDAVGLTRPAAPEPARITPTLDVAPETQAKLKPVRETIRGLEERLSRKPEEMTREEWAKFEKDVEQLKNHWAEAAKDPMAQRQLAELAPLRERIEAFAKQKPATNPDVPAPVNKPGLLNTIGVRLGLIEAPVEPGLLGGSVTPDAAPAAAPAAPAPGGSKSGPGGAPAKGSAATGEAVGQRAPEAPAGKTVQAAATPREAALPEAPVRQTAARANGEPRAAQAAASQAPAPKAEVLQAAAARTTPMELAGPERAALAEPPVSLRRGGVERRQAEPERDNLGRIEPIMQEQRAAAGDRRGGSFGGEPGRSPSFGALDARPIEPAASPAGEPRVAAGGRADKPPRRPRDAKPAAEKIDASVDNAAVSKTFGEAKPAALEPATEPGRAQAASQTRQSETAPEARPQATPAQTAARPVGPGLIKRGLGWVATKTTNGLVRIETKMEAVGSSLHETGTLLNTPAEHRGWGRLANWARGYTSKAEVVRVERPDGTFVLQFQKPSFAAHVFLGFGEAFQGRLPMAALMNLQQQPSERLADAHRPEAFESARPALEAASGTAAQRLSLTSIETGAAVRLDAPLARASERTPENLPALRAARDRTAQIFSEIPRRRGEALTYDAATGRATLEFGATTRYRLNLALDKDLAPAAAQAQATRLIGNYRRQLKYYEEAYARAEQARAPPSDQPYSGVPAVEKTLAEHGLKLEGPDRAQLENLERATGKLLIADGQTYHGPRHQNGPQSVLAMSLEAMGSALRSEPSLRNLSAAEKKLLILAVHRGAILHDAEAIFVRETADGSRSIVLLHDATKLAPEKYAARLAKNPKLLAKEIDPAKLQGEPLIVETLPDGSRLLAFPKPSETQSFIPTSLRTARKLGMLDGVSKEEQGLSAYMMLGTAFSPPELAARRRIDPLYERQLRAAYGDKFFEAAQLVRDRVIAPSDVLNYYRQPFADSIDGVLGFTKEKTDQNVQGTFFFFKMLANPDLVVKFVPPALHANLTAAVPHIEAYVSRLSPEAKAHLAENAVLYRALEASLKAHETVKPESMPAAEFNARVAQYAKELAANPGLKDLINRLRPELEGLPFGEMLQRVDKEVDLALVKSLTKPLTLDAAPAVAPAEPAAQPKRVTDSLRDWYYRKTGRDPEVMRVARLDPAARRSEIEKFLDPDGSRRKSEPEKLDKEVAAVMAAHGKEGEPIYCKVYACSKEQLAAKLGILKQGGIADPLVRKEALRLGFAGGAEAPVDVPLQSLAPRQPARFEYTAPIRIELAEKSLEIVSRRELIARHPDVAIRLNQDIEYFLIDPFDAQQYKALRPGESFRLGYDSPGRFTLPRSVSRSHLEIKRDGDSFLITDLGSTNGTQVAPPPPLAPRPPSSPTRLGGQAGPETVAYQMRKGETLAVRVLTEGAEQGQYVRVTYEKDGLWSVVHGQNQYRFRPGEEVVVGRKPSGGDRQIVIEGDQVSRNHVRFTLGSRGAIELTETSANGSEVSRALRASGALPGRQTGMRDRIFVADGGRGGVVGEVIRVKESDFDVRQLRDRLEKSGVLSRSETDILKAVRILSEGQMPYNKDFQVVDRQGRELDVERTMLVGKICQGVCRNQALIAGALVEGLIAEGRLTGQAYYVVGDGHAWMEHVDARGRSTIVDVAQRYDGPADKVFNGGKGLRHRYSDYAFDAFAPEASANSAHILAGANAEVLAGRPSLFARAREWLGRDANAMRGAVRAELGAKEFSGERLLEAFKRDPKLAEEFKQDVGVKEGYTLEEHTLMVLRQFERYHAEGLTPERQRLFRAMLALHDIGKPAAVRAGDKNRQHEFTVPLLKAALERLGFSKKDVALAEALVDGDPIAPLVRIKPAHDTRPGEVVIPKEALDASIKEVEALAARAGMTPAEFLPLIKKFYLTDAGSYTLDAGGKKALDALFDVSRAQGSEKGTMRLKPEHEAKLKPLEDHFAAPDRAPPRSLLQGLRERFARATESRRTRTFAEVQTELDTLTADIKSSLKKDEKGEPVIEESDVRRWAEGYKKITGVEPVRARDIVELMRDNGSDVTALYDRWIRIGLTTFSGRKFNEAGMETMLDHMFKAIREEGVAAGDVALISGMTNLGGVKAGYASAHKVSGLETQGITTPKALVYDVAPTDKAVVLGSRFGDESPLFLALSNVMLGVGGGGQAKAEILHAISKMGDRTILAEGFLEHKADGSRAPGAVDQLGRDAGGRWIADAEKDPARAGDQIGRMIVQVMRAVRDQHSENPFVQLAMQRMKGSTAEAESVVEADAQRYRVLRVLNSLQKKMADEGVEQGKISEGLLLTGQRMMESTAGIDNIKDNAGWKKAVAQALVPREGDPAGMQSVAAAAAKIDIDVMFASWFGIKANIELKADAKDRGLRRYFDESASTLPRDMVLTDPDAPHTFNKKDYSEIRLDVATAGLLKARDSRPEVFLGTREEMAAYYRSRGFTSAREIADSNGTSYLLMTRQADYGRLNGLVDALAQRFPSLNRSRKQVVLQGVDSESRLAQVSALMQTQGVDVARLVVRGELSRLRERNQEALRSQLLEDLQGRPVAAVVVGDKNYSVEALAQAVGAEVAEIKRAPMTQAGPFRYEKISVTEAATGKEHVVLAFAPAYGELTADLVSASYNVGARNYMLAGAGGSLVKADKVGVVHNVVSADYRGRRVDLKDVKGLEILRVKDAPDGHNNTSPTPLEQSDRWADVTRARGAKNVDQETFHVFDAIDKAMAQERRAGLDPKASVQVGLYMSDVVGSNGLASGTVDMGYAVKVREMARQLVERLGIGAVNGKSGPHAIAGAQPGLLARQGAQLSEMADFAPARDLTTVWDNGWGQSIRQFKGQKRFYEVETTAIGPAERAYLGDSLEGLGRDRFWVGVKQSDPNYVDVLAIAREKGFETILFAEPGKEAQIRGNPTFVLRNEAAKDGLKPWDEAVRDGKNDEYETNRAQHYRQHLGDGHVKPASERPGFLYQGELSAKETAARIETESRQAKERIVSEINALFAKNGKRPPELVDQDKLDAFIGDMKPVLISGSSKKSWPNVSAENQKLVEITLGRLLDRLDPKKHLLVTGGTEFGAEAILHRLAAQKGFKVLGTITENANPAEVSEHVTHLVMQGINWFGKSRPVLHLVKSRDGFVIFQGGGQILAEEIELAARTNTRMYLQKGPEGSSAEAAKRMPQHAFETFDDLAPRLENTGVFRPALGQRVERALQPLFDQLSRLVGRDPKVLENSRLSDGDRRAALAKLGLNGEQIEAAMRAHDEVSCRVYNCTRQQLARKVEIMKGEAAGDPQKPDLIPAPLRARLIREGYAGSSRAPEVEVKAAQEPAPKPFVNRVPRSMEDFVQVFGTQKAIDANVNADIILALAKEWDVKDLEVVKRRIRNANEVYTALAEVRDANRKLRENFEALNPGKEAGSLLSDLAKETHTAWLASVKASPDYVAYTQPLHDLVLEQVQKGVVKIRDAAGQRVALTAAEFEGVKKKFKLKPSDFEFAGEADRAAFEARFKQATGKEFKDSLINTVAGEWDALGALQARAQGPDWSGKRQAYLYGLQADSVGAIVAAFSGESGKALLDRLGSGSAQDKVHALADVLRKINVGWRVNNPWGGFSDRLIHQPFELEDKGGIGLPDIHKDAVVVKAILGVMDRHLQAGGLRLADGAESRLKHALEQGLRPALDTIVDQNALAKAVRETQPAEFEGTPKTMEDFVKLFGTKGAIDAHVNADIILALAKEWDVADLAEVTRRIRNATQVHEALNQLRDANRKLLGEFEAANPGKQTGAVLSDLARQTHGAWLAGVKEGQDYVRYDQRLHDLLLTYVKQGTIKVTDASGKHVALTVEEFESPKKKFKLKSTDFHFTSDAQRAEFEHRFATIAGRPLKGALINTVAGEWDALASIQARVNTEAWAAGRSAYLYGLQADSVGAIVGALSGKAGEAALLKLSGGTEAERLEALVDLLRKINVGWRVNNPWGGFNDRLINKPFDLEENGGIGLEDIRKDAVVLKAVLNVLGDRLAAGTVKLPDAAAASLNKAFQTGLRPALDKLLDRGELAEAVRRHNMHEAFTETSNAQLRRLAETDPIRAVSLKQAVLESELPQAQVDAIRASGARTLSAYDFLKDADSPSLQAAYSLGSRDPGGLYDAFVDRARLQHWETAYRSLYDDNSRPRTTDFLERITAAASDKPVVFFVPKAGERRVTHEELDWLLAHPDRMKNVVFVFGAYDMISPEKLASSGLSKLDAQRRSALLADYLRGAPEPVALKGARMTEAQRVAALKELGLDKDQIAGVLKAHEDVPCEVYACSQAQLEAKLDILKAAGIKDPLLRKRLIREGFAGEAPAEATARIPEIITVNGDRVPSQAIIRYGELLEKMAARTDFVTAQERIALKDKVQQDLKIEKQVRRPGEEVLSVGDRAKVLYTIRLEQLINKKLNEPAIKERKDFDLLNNTFGPKAREHFKQGILGASQPGRPVDERMSGGVRAPNPAMDLAPVRTLEDVIRANNRAVAKSAELPPDHPSLTIVSDLRGIATEKLPDVEKLGAQGEEQSCARYAVAACSIRLGRAIELGRVKQEAARQLIEHAEFMLPKPAEADYVLLKAQLDALVADPNGRGMTPGEVETLAARLGLESESLNGGRLLKRQIAAIHEPADSPAAAAVLADAAVLRETIAARLESGEGVIASVILKDHLHAVAVLQFGKTASGVEVVKFYDSILGKVLTIPAADFLPSQAVALKAPERRAAPRPAADAWQDHYWEQQRLRVKSGQETLINNGEGVLISAQTLYHGSATPGIKELKAGAFNTMGSGIYLTSDMAAAKGYAKTRAESPFRGARSATASETPYLYETRVQDLKLMDVRTEEKWRTAVGDFQTWLAKRNHPDAEFYRKIIDRYGVDAVRTQDGGPELFSEYAKSRGYHGILSLEGGEAAPNGVNIIGNHDSYVIFDPAKVTVVGASKPGAPPRGPPETTIAIDQLSVFSDEGGQGTIYRVSDRPGMLLKLYDKIPGGRATQEHLLKQKGVQDQLIQEGVRVVPIEIARVGENAWGLLMPEVKGDDLGPFIDRHWGSKITGQLAERYQQDAFNILKRVDHVAEERGLGKDLADRRGGMFDDTEDFGNFKLVKGPNGETVVFNIDPFNMGKFVLRERQAAAAAAPPKPVEKPGLLKRAAALLPLDPLAALRAVENAFKNTVTLRQTPEAAQNQLRARILSQKLDERRAKDLIAKADEAYQRDPQTKLYKRNVFEAKARELIAARPDAVIGLLDMNNFGAYNKGLEALYAGDPSFAMNKGDLALAKSAARLEGLARATGVTLGRIGGEEIGFAAPDRASAQKFLASVQLEMRGGKTLFADMERTAEPAVRAQEQTRIDEAVAAKGVKLAEELSHKLGISLAEARKILKLPVGDYTSGLVDAKGMDYAEAMKIADAALLWAKDRNLRGANVEPASWSRRPDGSVVVEQAKEIPRPTLDTAEYLAGKKRRDEAVAKLADLPNLERELAELKKVLRPDDYQRLIDRAAVDDLTGLGTRSYFLAVKKSWETRYAKGGEAALISPDMFKQLNDGLDHAEGDRFLERLGYHIANQRSAKTGVEKGVRWGQSKDMLLVGQNAFQAAANVEKAMNADPEVRRILALWAERNSGGVIPENLGRLRVARQVIRPGAVQFDGVVKDLFRELESLKKAPAAGAEVSINSGLGLMLKGKTLYHGSPTEGIKRFDATTQFETRSRERDGQPWTLGRGLYLTSGKTQAEGYAQLRYSGNESTPADLKNRAAWSKRKPVIYEVSVDGLKLLDLRPPENYRKVMTGFGPYMRSHDVGNAKGGAILAERIAAAIKADDGKAQARYTSLALRQFPDMFADYVKSLGYDGLIRREGGENNAVGVNQIGDHDTYVILDPSLVKIVKENPLTPAAPAEVETP